MLTEKLARRGRHLTREYGVNPLHVLRVEDVMEPPLTPPPAVLPVLTYPDDLLETAMRKLLEHEVEMLPVASPDDPGRVVGYVRSEERRVGKESRSRTPRGCYSRRGRPRAGSRTPSERAPMSASSGGEHG